MSINIFTVFAADYYRAINPDLAGFNDTEARRHFCNNGLAEGRQFSPFIDLNWYRSNNPDLRNLSNFQLFFHLLNSGINEDFLSLVNFPERASDSAALGAQPFPKSPLQS